MWDAIDGDGYCWALSHRSIYLSYGWEIIKVRCLGLMTIDGGSVALGGNISSAQGDWHTVYHRSCRRDWRDGPSEIC